MNKRILHILTNLIILVFVFISGTTVFAQENETAISFLDGEGNAVEAFTKESTLYISADIKNDRESVIICCAQYLDNGRLKTVNIKKITSDALENDCFKVDNIDENVDNIKAFVLDSMDNISPVSPNKSISKASEKTTEVRYDSVVTSSALKLSETEVACMSINSIAEITGCEHTENSLIFEDAEITFESGNRLAQYNDGNLMLETSPFYDLGRLYVPISVLEPTKCWAVYYDRFNDYVEIKTGTDYPKTEPKVFNVKDFGALGDGITDDGAAITAAMNSAILSGVPAKVVFEADKIYLVGERQDSMSYFELEEVRNLTIDGQGSEIVFEKCTNTFLNIENCANIRIENLSVDYKEPPFTQGKIIEVETKTGASDTTEYFVLEIEEGYPLPTTDKWVKYYFSDERTGGWWFGQLIDSVEDRIKFVKYGNFMIDSVTNVGDRQYKITFDETSTYWSQFMEVGDRFVLNTRFSAYDIGDNTHSGSTSMIQVLNSGDITFENVTLYSAPWLGASVGCNWGRINFIGFGEKVRDGRLMAVNSDGIHCWRNKEGITVKNSTFMNSLDDQLNTKGEDAVITGKNSSNEVIVDYNLNFRVGDKLMVFDKESHTVLGIAYLKEFSVVGTGIKLVLDREIEGFSVGNLIYNADSSASGSVVSGNIFMNSRRHAYITRSENSIFENNDVIDCGGAAVSASNEIMSGSSEGPFPSSFTMRNNRISAPGTISGHYPVEVMSWKAINGESKAVDGFLIEDNIIDVAVSDYNMQILPSDKKVVTTIRINSVKDLYMINNTIKSNAANSDEYHILPVYINNSDIKLIDGLDCNYKTKSENGAIITFDSCNFETENIKNIKDSSGRGEKAYSTERSQY